MTEQTKKVLMCLCRHCVGLMYSWIPLPARCVAESCNISLYMARKELHILQDLGYCKTDSISYGEECPLPYNGWTITSEAKATEEYKQAEYDEAVRCSEIFGGTVDSYILSDKEDKFPWL